MNKKILHLTLKRQWFDLIATGKKNVEYREIKPYWTKRLIDSERKVIEYDEIYFKNGYSKDAPFMRVKWKGMMIQEHDMVDYYAIHLGEILEIKNWNGIKVI